MFRVRLRQPWTVAPQVAGSQLPSSETNSPRLILGTSYAIFRIKRSPIGRRSPSIPIRLQLWIPCFQNTSFLWNLLRKYEIRSIISRRWTSGGLGLSSPWISLKNTNRWLWLKLSSPILGVRSRKETRNLVRRKKNYHLKKLVRKFSLGNHKLWI